MIKLTAGSVHNMDRKNRANNRKYEYTLIVVAAGIRDNTGIDILAFTRSEFKKLMPLVYGGETIGEVVEVHEIDGARQEGYFVTTIDEQQYFIPAALYTKVVERASKPATIEIENGNIVSFEM